MAKRFQIGDAYLIDCPIEVGWKQDPFYIVEIYKYYCVLSNGLFRVSYTKWELERQNPNKPIKGCWF